MNFKIVRKLCVKVVFFSKEKSLLTVFFLVQQWSSFGLYETLSSRKIGDTVERVSTMVYRHGGPLFLTPPN